MRSLVSWTAPLLGAAVIAGVLSCSGGDGGDPIDPGDDPGSVRATVQAGGEPLEAVTVQLFTNNGATPLETGATGATGQVTFVDLDAGDYDVQVVLPAGYELATGQTGRRDVTVESGEQATVVFALEEVVPPPTDGQVRARVLEGANGVEAVDVMLFTAGGSTPLATLATAADGRVLFDSLDPGSYDVAIEMPVGFGIAAGDTTRKAVAVTAGNTTDVQFSIVSSGPPTVEIFVGGTSFSDADVTIQPGTRVRWIWQNGSHTVTPTGHSEWTSTVLNSSGDVLEHTFNSVGQFAYHCIPHQSLGMTGIIRVQN